MTTLKYTKKSIAQIFELDSIGDYILDIKKDEFYAAGSGERNGLNYLWVDASSGETATIAMRRPEIPAEIP